MSTPSSPGPARRSTASLQAADHAHVWHPFTAMTAYERESAPIICEAEGFEVIDTQGRRYLDGTSSLWCNIHGHRVPELDQALQSQLGRVAHSTLLGLGNVPSIELAEELVRRVPAGLTRVFYSDDGSTAVEAALKMAYQYYRQRNAQPEQRDLFVCLGGAYHGDTLGAVSVGGIELFHGIYGRLLFRTLQVPSPGATRWDKRWSRAEYHAYCEAELVRVLEEHGSRIAAIVIEPLVQAAAGMLVHPAGYLRLVRELATAHDVLLIADEVAVGFGRTGSLFACEQERVSPDLLCLSKGLTGGYLPLAATLTTEAIYAAFLGEPHAGRTFFHGHTYTGNPLACAVALATLRRIDTHRVLENVAQTSQYLAGRLFAFQQLPTAWQSRQKGLMCGVELVADRQTGAPFPSQMRVGHAVALAARRRGAIIRPLGDTIVLMPAPAMPVELVRRLCDVVADSIREVVTHLPQSEDAVHDTILLAE